MDTQEIRAGDLTGGTVLVIHLPVGKGDTDLREMRDYVAESISKGVLVLNANTAYKLEQFPPLGGILCQADVPEGDAAADPNAPEALLREKDAPRLAAEAEAAEKQQILRRLKEYRKAHGLGCLSELAGAFRRVRGRALITETTLQLLLTGDMVLEIEDWRRIGQALDKLSPEVAPGE